MSGIVGAAGGIGGFYLPVIMGIAKEGTGSYQMGFATFGVLAALAFGLVVLHRARWLEWALPKESHVVVEPIRAGVQVDSGV
jgi:NNP family nitrate/nitrite transporter-like MFS transporter